MPYSILGKNVMLNALTALATHVGLLFTTVFANCTGAIGSVISKAGHTLANGDLVMVSLLGTGEGTGLFNAVPYYVVGVGAGVFSLSETPGGAAIAFSTAIVDITVTKYAEISGGTPAYARKPIAFAAAAVGLSDDSTNGAAFDVPAGAVVNAVGHYSALTAGTLYAIDDVVQESFGAQGTYTLTDAKLDLNADRVAA